MEFQCFERRSTNGSGGVPSSKVPKVVRNTSATIRDIPRKGALESIAMWVPQRLMTKNQQLRGPPRKDIPDACRRSARVLIGQRFRPGSRSGSVVALSNTSFPVRRLRHLQFDHSQAEAQLVALHAEVFLESMPWKTHKVATLGVIVLYDADSLAHGERSDVGYRLLDPSPGAPPMFVGKSPAGALH